MAKSVKKIGQMLLLVFALGMILLNFPILSNFNQPILWNGLPPAFVYIFVVWAFMIAVLWLIFRKQ
ncbi:MAG: hypothetical protein RMJ97_04930 [Raineya sp.]|nr:hypothetical protein [Raineya sp.]